jgi:hypothetical protein
MCHKASFLQPRIKRALSNSQDKAQPPARALSGLLIIHFDDGLTLIRTARRADMMRDMILIARLALHQVIEG